MKSAIEDEEVINKIFNYCIKYGTVLTIKRYDKKISFLTSLNVRKIYEDKEAFDLMFNKKVFPEVYSILEKNNFDCNYILFIGVDENFRNRGIASQLVGHYLKYYKSSSIFITDVDNKYAYKIFGKFGFEVHNKYSFKRFKKIDFDSTKISKNYYLMFKNSH